MPKTNTYKALAARTKIKVILAENRMLEGPRTENNEEMYAWLADYGYTWDTGLQAWRKRQPGTHGPLKRAIVKESSFVLVRIMAKRDILDNDRENLALAFEVIGYEIVSFSQPIENRENGFYRVYIKAKAR